MKKNILSVLFVFLGFCFAQQYKINNVDYNIEGSGLKILGKTSPAILERNIPIDKTLVFESEDELLKYLEDYEQKLANTRAFDSFLVEYFIKEEISEDNILPVELLVSIKDSIHMLALPYFKYDSNVGTQLKLKAKDTNFIGTMNTMSADILLEIQQDDINSQVKIAPGLNFKYDFPFKMGPFNSTWINNYGILYIIEEDFFEWDAKTGLNLELPFNFLTWNLELYQYFNRNYSYYNYGDDLYFNEEARLSTTLKLYDFKSIGKLNYTPYMGINFYWDNDGINKLNTDLSGPTLSIGHSLSTSKINWNNNFRTGSSLILSNTYSYNFQRNILYPYLSFEALLYKAFVLTDKPFFNTIALNSNLYYFDYLINYNKEPYINYLAEDGSRIGGRLRGIRDEQRVCKTTSAFVFNFDFPVRLFTINFEKSIFRFFSCDVQLSPFFDMALTYNKATDKWYNLKDGLYSAGFEVLVYPQKWSSFTVRAMAGLDIGRLLLKNNLNSSWREDVSPYEFSIGIGLHY